MQTVFDEFITHGLNTAEERINKIKARSKKLPKLNCKEKKK